MTWPPLPREVMGLGGVIRVARPVQMSDKDWGQWVAEQRLVRVRADLPGEVAWHTFLHELWHAHADDLGLPIPDELIEMYCDTMASAMIHVFRAAFKVR